MCGVDRMGWDRYGVDGDHMGGWVERVGGVGGWIK